MKDKPQDTGDEVAKLWLPVPGDDDCELKGYPWPASALSRSDMEKLTQLRATTGRPITVLIHEAVSVLFELTRSDMAKVEQLALRTGLSVKEVLAQAIHFMYEGETGNDKYVVREANDQTPLRVHPASDETSPTPDGE